MRVAEISGHAARPRRLAQRTLVRHAAVAFLATGLVLGFAAVHFDFSPMHRWNRAIGDASLVLIAVSVGIGPLARLWRPAMPLIPFRREMGIHGCLLAVVHAVIILVGWVEWDLMRLFGSGRIAAIVDKMGMKEGEVLQHSMLSSSIERAQKKVEENNFGIRKRLLEYDDVMNSQRTVIYKRRRHALFGDRLKLDILNMFHEVVSAIAAEYHPLGDHDGYQLELFRKFSTECPVDADAFKRMKLDEVIDRTYDAVMNAYDRHMARTTAQAMPVVTDVFLNRGQQYQNIVIPVTDGKRTMDVLANLEKAYKSECRELITSIEKFITLSIIDNEWKEHLREMDELRRSVQNASIEQKDPLLIYKLESFELFKAMIDRINAEVVGFLARAGLPSAQPEIQQAQTPRAPQQRLQTSRSETPELASASRGAAPRPSAGGNAGQGPMPPSGPRAPITPVRVEEKIGRNDPCPCGSGRKCKQCHGK